MALPFFQLFVFYRSYLYDLMETNHLFLKMLEDYSRSRECKIAVKVKKKKRRKPTGRECSDFSVYM